ncbi:MAG: sensor histidine kinase, partial [Sphingomonadales bacterium]
MRPPHKLSFARLSTGTKMLLILSAAMLPLGFIALLTSLDLAESAAIERRGAAQTATALYAAQIEAVLESNLNGVRTLAVSTQSAEYICAALARQAHLKASSWPPTAAFDADRRKLCQSFGTPIDRLAPADPESDHVWLDARRGLFRFTATRADGSLTFEADLPIKSIQLKGRQEEGLPLLELALRQGESKISLIERTSTDSVDELRISQPLADGRLAITADYAAAKVQASTALLVMMPILMWAAAALFGWLVVSRLLLHPLHQLKRSIDTWQDSRDAFDLPRMNTPSEEIRELAESFANVSARIHEHERELEEGLQRQTRLTREVHHRVKNNLQVVSSLINLHARGAQGDVAAAYGAIQRRVDALAVVHRNHYAELEENRGVSMRALAGELAGSLRASAPPSAAGMPIALNMIDAYVT